MKSKYIILANPVSGPLDISKKFKSLKAAAKILNISSSDIIGLDTASPEEFSDAARLAESKAKVIVVAGGDGSFSNVYNSVSKNAVLAYLPFGTVNSSRLALGLPPDIESASHKIKAGSVRELDAILCNDQTLALTASIGFELDVISKRGELCDKGYSRMVSYIAAIGSVLLNPPSLDIAISIDDAPYSQVDLLSLHFAKHPFHGYGGVLNPGAELDSGLLHSRILTSGYSPIKILGVAATSYLGGNKMGSYVKTPGKIDVCSYTPLSWHADGDLQSPLVRLSFKVIPERLNVKF